MVSVKRPSGFNPPAILRTLLLLVCSLSFANACLRASAQGAPFYGTKIVASSGQGVDKIDRHVSINDNGYVAFLGTTSGKQNIYANSPPYASAPHRLMSTEWEFPVDGAAPTQVFGPPQINNANQVAARRYLIPTVYVVILEVLIGFPILQQFNPPITYVETWDANKTNRTATQLALGDPGLSFYVNFLDTGVAGLSRVA